MCENVSKNKHCEENETQKNAKRVDRIIDSGKENEEEYHHAAMNRCSSSSSQHKLNENEKKNEAFMLVI